MCKVESKGSWLQLGIEKCAGSEETAPSHPALPLSLSRVFARRPPLVSTRNPHWESPAWHRSPIAGSHKSCRGSSPCLKTGGQAHSKLLRASRLSPGIRPQNWVKSGHRTRAQGRERGRCSGRRRCSRSSRPGTSGRPPPARPSSPVPGSAAPSPAAC